MAGDFQLYGADNRPIVSGDGVKTPLIGSVVPDQLATRWYSQVSKGLDPVTLSAILDEAVSGAIERQFKLFEEMEEKFPELRLALMKHKLKACRRSWQITPPDRPRNPDLAKKKTEFAEQCFGEIKDFSRTMFNLLDAVGKNLSACEIAWIVNGREVGIERMPWVNYRHLYYAPDRPELMLRPDLQSYAYAPFTNWPKKFVVFEHLTKSGHAARGALLRPVAWAFMLYLFATKDLAALVETFGVDVAFAYYRPGADKKEQDDVLMHVQRIAIRAGAFPEGTKIELERAAAGSGGGSPQENSVRYYADLVTKLFLGSTLATTAGDKGARSLGEVQDEETVELVDWSAVLLAETISDTALPWLCGFNFAEPGDNPWFTLPAAKRKDLAALANVINLLVRVGARIPEKWTHSEFDIPEPAEGEEEMILKADAPTTPPLQDSITPSPPDPNTPQSLTGRALGFSTITEHQAQAVLDDLRAQAVRESQDVAAFDQLTGPLKKLIARTVDPKVALAELDAVAKEIKPEKLAGVLEQVIILSDLVGRAVVNEQTGVRRPETEDRGPKTLTAFNSAHDKLGLFAPTPDAGGSGGGGAGGGSRKNWRDLGRPSAEKLKSKPEPNAISVEAGSRMMAEGVTEKNPLGQEAHFTAQTLEHFATPSKAGRPAFVEVARTTVKSPNEIWRQEGKDGPQHAHIAVFHNEISGKKSGGAVFVTDSKGNVRSYVRTGKISKLNKFRKGELAYATE